MTKAKCTLDWLTDLNEFTIPSYSEWEKVAQATLKGKAFENLFTSTDEDIILKPVYTMSDAAKIQVKGPIQKKENNWGICQVISGATIEELVSLIQQAIENGQTIINLQTKQTDEGIGALIENQVELGKLLDAIPHDKCDLFINTRLHQSAFISALCTYQHNKGEMINGVVATDPVGEWVLQGNLPSSLSFFYDEMSCIIKELNRINSPIKTILVQSHPFHNGGANAVQELAYTLSVAIEYVRQNLERGITIDEMASRFAFTFSVGSNLFMEMAKLKAAKYLWASIVNEFGGSKESQKMWFHARTSATTKTKYDPYVNIVRATVETFAAVMGGANGIHTSTFDEPILASTDFSTRIARNVQSILMEEAHLGRVNDPSKGSFYVEKLSNELAEKAWEHLQKIERKGGIIGALQENFVQDEIIKTRDARFERIELRKERIVGINMYANVFEGELLTIENRDTTSKKKRTQSKSTLSFSCSQPDYFLRLAAELEKGTSFTNIQERILAEGNEHEIEPIRAIRWSMKIELLRDNAKRYLKKFGKNLSAQLINLGDTSTHKPRSDFSKDFLEVGGFQVTQSKSFLTLPEVEAGIKDLNGHVFVLCGQDEVYDRMGKNVLALLRNKFPNSILFIAGKLKSGTFKELTAAGLNDCINVHTNCYIFLLELQTKLEGYYE